MTMLTIGDVAKQAGVTHDTIRLYERYGLIAEPKRAPNGYRQYTEEAVRQLRFIKYVKAMGFTLKEVGELLAIRRTSNNGCLAVRQQAKEKLSNVEERIMELRRLQKALEKVIETCEQQKPDGACPLLKLLDS